MLFDILFQEIASHLRKSAHRKKHVFRNFWHPHSCKVFSTICGTVVEENEKTQGDRNWVFGTPWPILRLRGLEISVRDISRNSKFYHVLSVSVVPSVSVESVIESVMLWSSSHQRLFLSKRSSKFVVFHPNLEPPILYDNLLEKWNPDAWNAGKKSRSKFQGPRASRPPCLVILYSYMVAESVLWNRRSKEKRRLLHNDGTSSCRLAQGRERSGQAEPRQCGLSHVNGQVRTRTHSGRPGKSESVGCNTSEVHQGLAPRVWFRIAILLQVGQASRKLVRTWIVKQLFQDFSSLCQRGREIETKTLCKHWKTDKISTKFLNGKLDWPC